MSILKAILYTSGLIVLLLIYKLSVVKFNINEITQVGMLTLVLLFALLLGYGFDFKKFKAVNNPSLKFTQEFFIGLIGVLGIYLLYVSLQILLWDLVLKEDLVVQDIALSLHNLILMLLILPLAEELFFRNLLLRKLYMKYEATKAIIISALLFAIAHVVADNGILPQFIGGLFFGYLYIVTKNDWFLTFKLHISFNLLSIVILSSEYLRSQVFSFETVYYTFFLICGIFLIFISAYWVKKLQTVNI